MNRISTAAISSDSECMVTTDGAVVRVAGGRALMEATTVIAAAVLEHAVWLVTREPDGHTLHRFHPSGVPAAPPTPLGALGDDVTIVVNRIGTRVALLEGARAVLVRERDGDVAIEELGERRRDRRVLVGTRGVAERTGTTLRLRSGTLPPLAIPNDLRSYLIGTAAVVHDGNALLVELVGNDLATALVYDLRSGRIAKRIRLGELRILSIAERAGLVVLGRGAHVALLDLRAGRCISERILASAAVGAAIDASGTKLVIVGAAGDVTTLDRAMSDVVDASATQSIPGRAPASVGDGDRPAPSTMARGSSPDVLAHGSRPDVLAHGSRPDVIARGSSPDALAHGSRPDVLARGSCPDVLAHGSRPEGSAHGSCPDVLAHGSRLDGIARGSRPDGIARGSHPEVLARGSRPDGVARGSRPEVLARGSHPERWIADDIEADGADADGLGAVRPTAAEETANTAAVDLTTTDSAVPDDAAADDLATADSAGPDDTASNDLGAADSAGSADALTAADSAAPDAAGADASTCAGGRLARGTRPGLRTIAFAASGIGADELADELADGSRPDLRVAGIVDDETGCGADVLASSARPDRHGVVDGTPRLGSLPRARRDASQPLRAMSVGPAQALDPERRAVGDRRAPTSPQRRAHASGAPPMTRPSAPAERILGAPPALLALGEPLVEHGVCGEVLAAYLADALAWIDGMCATAQAIARGDEALVEEVRKVELAAAAAFARWNRRGVPHIELVRELGLSALAGTMLLVVAAPQIWGELARSYHASASDPARPLVDELLLAQLLEADVALRTAMANELDAGAPLVRTGAIEIGPGLRPYAALSVHPAIARRLAGAPRARPQGPGLADVVGPHTPIAALTTSLAAPRTEPVRIVVRGRRGMGRRTLAAALARQAGRSVTVVDAADPATLASRLAGVALRGNLPCLDLDDASEEPAVRSEIRAVVDAHAGPLFVRAPRDGELPLALGHEMLELTDLDETARRDVWRRQLVGHRLATPEVATTVGSALAARCNVGPGPIIRACAKLTADQVAAAGRPDTGGRRGEEATAQAAACPVRRPDTAEEAAASCGVATAACPVGRPDTTEEAAASCGVATAARPVERPDTDPYAAELESALAAVLRGYRSTRIAAIAERVDALATWDQLVVPEDIAEALHELVARVRHRRTVLETWGLSRVATTARAVTALFQGGPGTGKTMAAGVIAATLGYELWRIDLSKVMSKWVGETEKNLAAVFDAAEEGEIVLLFDEADSLFAKRSDGKSGGDRPGHVATNYLLQRLDAFGGVAILTTNFGTAIDPAFKRRLSVQIEFPFPDEEDRERLWRAHLPASLPTTGDLRVGALARQYQLSGGYIRNAVLRAAYLAAARGGAITAAHLVRAVVLEKERIGKLGDGRID